MSHCALLPLVVGSLNRGSKEKCSIQSRLLLSTNAIHNRLQDGFLKLNSNLIKWNIFNITFFGKYFIICIIHNMNLFILEIPSNY